MVRYGAALFVTANSAHTFKFCEFSHLMKFDLQSLPRTPVFSVKKSKIDSQMKRSSGLHAVELHPEGGRPSKLKGRIL